MLQKTHCKKLSYMCAPAGAAQRNFVPKGNQGVRIAKAILILTGDSVSLTKKISDYEEHGEF